MLETKVGSLAQEDPLEKEMATHSSVFTWEIPWTEEPGSLQFMGLQRVQHDLVTEQQRQSHLGNKSHRPVVSCCSSLKPRKLSLPCQAQLRPGTSANCSWLQNPSEVPQE